MNAEKNATNPIAARLTEAIDQLQQDVKRVEIWAGALTAYAQPVATYEIDDRHKLPAKPPNDAE